MNNFIKQKSRNDPTDGEISNNYISNKTVNKNPESIYNELFSVIKTDLETIGIKYINIRL